MLRCKEVKIHIREAVDLSLRADLLALGAFETGEATSTIIMIIIYGLTADIFSEDPNPSLVGADAPWICRMMFNTDWDCYKALNPWQKLIQGQHSDL